MMDIFQEVMGGAEQAGSMVWKGNYHSDGGKGGGVLGGVQSTVHMEEAVRVARLVRGCRFSCIMQEWGGKREVMYTAFKALGDSVDYVQVRIIVKDFVHRQPIELCEEIFYKDNLCVSQ